MPASIDCMVSVVNRDDLVPRLTVQNVEALCNSTLCPGQVAKTKAWMEEDWKAVQDYKRVLELRRRDKPSAATQDVQEDAAVSDEKVQLLVEAGLSEEVAKRSLELENGNLDLALLRGTEVEVEGEGRTEAMDVDMESNGGVEGASASNSTLQQNVEQGAKRFLSHLQFAGEKVRTWSTEAAKQVQSGTSYAAASAYSRQANGTSGATGAEHHTRFFIPGQVIHIYNQNGLGRAALTPSTHDIFARINVCANMLLDHKVVSYQDAVRQACILDAKTPQWESFEDRTTCACCGADFNWAYVLQSEPQRMLARHNCFKCGRVVCHGCSQTRQAWPQLGAISVVRSCDACIFSPESD